MKPGCIKAMEQCVRHLCTAVSTASLYGAQHQQVARLCSSAHVQLGEALAEEDVLSLMRVDDQLAIAGTPLARSVYAERFARSLKERGIGHLKFMKEVTPDELQSLVMSLAQRDEVVCSSASLRLGQVEVRFHDPVAGSGALSTEVSQVLSHVGSEELARIMEVYGSVSQNGQLKVSGLSEIVSEFIDVFALNADPLLTLVPLRTMDEYTFTHSLNVCLLNLAQATALGINGPLLHDVGLAAMLHDIGKLFVPEEILNKPGRVEGKDWEILKAHPVTGAEYLVQTPGVPRMAVVNAYEHHMRFDQLGYPTVKKGWQQNICSQMTAISDTFDALRTIRPYREPMAVEDVLDHISGLAGTQLHPVLVDNFLRLMKVVHPECQRPGVLSEGQA